MPCPMMKVEMRETRILIGWSFFLIDPTPYFYSTPISSPQHTLVSFAFPNLNTALSATTRVLLLSCFISRIRLESNNNHICHYLLIKRIESIVLAALPTQYMLTLALPIYYFILSPLITFNVSFSSIDIAFMRL